MGRLRLLVVALPVVLFIAGCGSNDEREDASGPPAGSLDALWKAPGEDVGLIQGTSDYAPGSVRVSFLVIRKDGRPVERSQARVWVARGRGQRPFERATARLEPIGPPESDLEAEGHGHAAHLYVAHVRIPAPGKYWLLAEPVGGAPIQGLATLDVRRKPATPALGERAIPSRTPTLTTTRGDLSPLTTASRPERALYRYSVADSLAARTPFVLVFATPKFCTSRTCGPTVDVVDHVRRRFARSGARFIHVEIYEGNDPKRGVNRWVKEWKLPSEPWVFVVGRDGRIAAKFEGSVSVRELTAAVREVV